MTLLMAIWWIIETISIYMKTFVLLVLFPFFRSIIYLGHSSKL